MSAWSSSSAGNVHSAPLDAILSGDAFGAQVEHLDQLRHPGSGPTACQPNPKCGPASSRNFAGLAGQPVDVPADDRLEAACFDVVNEPVPLRAWPSGMGTDILVRSRRPRPPSPYGRRGGGSPAS
ncbi:hypothetical protein Francci3_3894 [Frankia casuarinae]|uniref:Uncharacterized protein n=1 Tax=Frankia casuarinae (strain DSM 45818 / CECT 9043 / HFP020203 / CcI3) TaxID=106370 RepID=Q2J648_FRACC|nr:hypothetical protein Francci3_3894 [Frankia casuarinae]